MPKAILTYRLPQEQEEFDNAVRGAEWRWALEELDEFLRQDLKHGTGRKTSEEIRDELRRILDERGLS